MSDLLTKPQVNAGCYAIGGTIGPAIVSGLMVMPGLGMITVEILVTVLVLPMPRAMFAPATEPIGVGIVMRVNALLMVTLMFTMVLLMLDIRRRRAIIMRHDALNGSQQQQGAGDKQKFLHGGFPIMAVSPM